MKTFVFVHVIINHAATNDCRLQLLPSAITITLITMLLPVRRKH